MLVLGIIATADVAARAAKAKVHPGVAHGEAFLATGGVGRAGHDPIEVTAFRIYEVCSLGAELQSPDRKSNRPTEAHALTLR
jgi:hypothetical protein